MQSNLSTMATWSMYRLSNNKKNGCCREVAVIGGSTVVTFKASKGLFTWSGGPLSSGVGFFCFHALEDTKQKKLTPLDRGPPLLVNRV